MKYGRPEVLAPAGDTERLIAALEYGADAVYLAGKIFGMRATPANFTEEELKSAVELCHKLGRKLYVTCNTLPRNHELPELPGFLKYCGEIGVDAFIISDVGVLMQAKKYAPETEIHISTQAGVVNYESANAFYELGARRVVLARELTLEEIAEIRKNTPADLQIEAFVHEAMCMSFSGRCLLSDYMTGRDANRGQCAQPCRWEYFVTERKRPDQHFTLEQEEKGAFIFNSRDMCLIRRIPELMSAGIDSLKIEGRAKSAYYVASTVSAYRRAVDFHMANPGIPLPESIAEETEKTSHREYSEGFFFGGEPGQTPESGGYIRKYELAAVCDGRQGEYIRLKQRGRFFEGETVDILVPNGENMLLTVSHIYNEAFEPITVAPHAEMTVYWKTDADIPKGAYLRIKR